MICKYSVSKEKFNVKPVISDFSNVIYVKKEVELNNMLDEICKEIKDGHIFAHNYNVRGEIFKAAKNISKESFSSTHIIPFDLDYVTISIDKIMNLLKYKPSIHYSTFSHEETENKRHYRLLYVFQNTIEGQNEYHEVYDALNSQISIDLKVEEEMNVKKLDRHMRNCTQVIIGSKSDCILSNNYITYDKRLFVNQVNNKEKTNNEFKANSLVVDTKIVDSKANNKTKKESKKKSNNSIKNNNSNINNKYIYYISKWKKIENDFKIVNNEFIELFKRNLSIRDNNKTLLLSDYKEHYPIFDSQELTYNQFGYACLDKDYKSIIRIWDYNKITNKKSIKKVKVGQRKNTLYTTSLRLLKMRDISFDYLLYLLVYEVYNFYEKQHEFPFSDIFDVAFNSYDANLKGNNHIFFDENNKKIKVDKKFCQKQNIKPITLARKAQKLEKDKKIDRFYNPELSIKDNLSILNSNGIKICKSRLYEYKRDLNEPQINFIEECQKTNSKSCLNSINIKEMEESFEKQKKIV